MNGYRGAILTIAVLLICSGRAFAAAPSAVAEREFAAVLRQKANAEHGEQLFDTCGACHGSTGAGASDGTVPAIAGQHFRVIAWELVSFRHGLRADPRMQHFTDRQHLERGAQDIADVAAYVSRLRPAPPAHAGANSRAPAADLYERHCSSCHGTDAQGDDPKRSPRLAGQHYEYLVRQMRDGSAGLRTNFATRHNQLSRRLSTEDLDAICAYLSGLKP